MNQVSKTGAKDDHHGINAQSVRNFIVRWCVRLGTGVITGWTAVCSPVLTRSSSVPQRLASPSEPFLADETASLSSSSTASLSLAQLCSWTPLRRVRRSVNRDAVSGSFVFRQAQAQTPCYSQSFLVSSAARTRTRPHSLPLELMLKRLSAAST